MCAKSVDQGIPQRPEEAEIEAVMQLYELGPTRSIRALDASGAERRIRADTVNLVAREHRRPEFLRPSRTS